MVRTLLLLRLSLLSIPLYDNIYAIEHCNCCTGSLWGGNQDCYSLGSQTLQNDLAHNEHLLYPISLYESVQSLQSADKHLLVVYLQPGVNWGLRGLGCYRVINKPTQEVYWGTHFSELEGVPLTNLPLSITYTTYNYCKNIHGIWECKGSATIHPLGPCHCQHVNTFTYNNYVCASLSTFWNAKKKIIVYSMWWTGGCWGFTTVLISKMMTVKVGHSRGYCNTGYDQSQRRRPSTLKCIGSISQRRYRSQPSVRYYSVFGQQIKKWWSLPAVLQYRVDQSQGQRPGSLLSQLFHVNVNVTDTILWQGHHDRVMQLNWLYFCGICHMMPLKVWPNTALGCNHQSICMPQLQPLCSAALVPNVLPRRDEGSGKPCAVIKAS